MLYKQNLIIIAITIHYHIAAGTLLTQIVSLITLPTLPYKSEFKSDLIKSPAELNQNDSTWLPKNLSKAMTVVIRDL